MALSTAPGRLEVICGPMFAGKTTALIARLSAARAAGLEAVALKPALDTRYAHAAITTHTGERLPALAAACADEVMNLLGDAGVGGVVGIDEAHFFGAALVAPVRALLLRGVRVIVAGVERDHRGEPFEPFPALLVEADEVVKLHAVCARCGGPAVHSQRMFASNARVAVGGPGDYEARCQRCFEPPAD
jgi:thymidine kinase